MGYTLSKRSGKWSVYFTDREGKRFRRSTKQEDKRRATVVADEWYRRHADPTYSAANETTIQAAADRLKEELKHRKRSSETINHFYRIKLSHIARVLGADTSLSKIDARMVDRYISEREEEGASSNTIGKELTALRQMLKTARRRGEFDKEVSQVMPISYDNGYKPRETRITEIDAWRLIRELPDGIARYTAFVCATTARDKAVGRARGRHLLADSIKVEDRKTKGATRNVPLNELTAPFAAFAFHGIDDDEPVASGVTSVRHAYDRATERLGLPHLSPNDIRRSVAHWLLARGVPRHAAAAFMGHANTKMLDTVYGKLDSTELGDTIRKALGSSVEGTWKNASNRRDHVDTLDGVSAKNTCAGTESNRRHGDFQSTPVPEAEWENTRDPHHVAEETWKKFAGSRDRLLPPGLSPQATRDAAWLAWDIYSIHGCFFSAPTAPGIPGVSADAPCGVSS